MAENQGMANTIVSAVVQTVLEKLNSDMLEGISYSWNLKDECNTLASIFTTIQLVLKDAEMKQRKSEAVHNWLVKLKDAAYDAEDLLDQVATEVLKQRGKRQKSNSLFSMPKVYHDLSFSFKIAPRVRNIREKLNAIADERLKYHLNVDLMDSQVSDLVENRDTSSLMDESEIYGRNTEKEMVIEKLIQQNNNANLSVYAVCGMGGIGKTTLAQLVYNDQRIATHFELRIWVCVSDDFNVKRLIRAILECIEGCGCDISQLDPLQRRLQEILRGKRFLLVLDDVWCEKNRLWNGLKKALKCGLEGSMVMVTTRIKNVATMMATMGIHHLQYLSEDDSWSLFKHEAFVNGEGEEILEKIGKEILKKCGGIPLAVKALGSLMRNKSEESEWLTINESEIWQLSEDENGILPALRLSYDNLSLQMRQCFAYCCIFPKDDELKKDTLIKLWMANGFVPSGDQSTCHSIFKELAMRSFFQDVQKDPDDRTLCKMHDLMHDLAQSVMKDETYILDYDRALKIPKTLRHLSIFWVPDSVSFDTGDDLTVLADVSLRSLIVHEKRRFTCIEGFTSFLSKQKYLRSLILHFDSMKQLPDIICKLEYLRYLAMRCNQVKTLPESLTCLYNLQTLKLTNTWELVELPKDLKYIKNLSFLEIDFSESMVSTPPDLGELNGLQTLSIFIVGQDASHHIYQLKDLNLGGHLTIRGLEYITNFEDAKSANLVAKKNLTSLVLRWKPLCVVSGMERQFNEVLDGLQPNHQIGKLLIENFPGSRLPSWMLSLSFKNLYEMSLISWPKCECVPPLGKLPSLKQLALRGLSSIKRLDAEWHGDGESTFPSLEVLILDDLLNLEEWTLADSGQSFPHLEYLDIVECPKLTSLPFLPAVKQLGIFASPIWNLPNILGNLCTVKDLAFVNCSNLEVLLPGDFKHLTSLETLTISFCPNLVSFPAAILEALCSLKYLYFCDCNKLNPLTGTLQSTSTLQKLSIATCPELKSLPESVKQLTSLITLILSQCRGLHFLGDGLGSLENLSELEIRRCLELKSLPDDFGSLKSLRKLKIIECPFLMERCMKPNGEDWPKIHHIPEILLD